MENTLKRILIIVLLILVGTVSFFVIAQKASSPATHELSILKIEDKIDTVLAFTTSSAVLSAGVTALPGDTATPIADKLADITEYFLLVLCILYSEKYLLTILGAGVFKILIPASCLIAIVSLFWNGQGLRRIVGKLVITGLALYFIIPIGLKVSDIIYDTYQESIDYTITATQDLTDETSEIASAAESQGLIPSITAKLTEAMNKAADILKRFVETVAVMIVTSCVIPLLVLLFFLWVINTLTGSSFLMQLPYFNGDPIRFPHNRRRKDQESE